MPTSTPPAPEPVKVIYRRRKSDDSIRIPDNLLQWIGIGASVIFSGLALWKINDLLNRPIPMPNGHQHVEEPVPQENGQAEVIDMPRMSNPNRATVNFTPPSAQEQSNMDFRYQTAYDQPKAGPMNTNNSVPYSQGVEEEYTEPPPQGEVPQNFTTDGYVPATGAHMEDIRNEIKKNGVNGRFLGTYMRS